MTSRTELEILDDTHVRITRSFAAPAALVWEAHHNADHMKRWMLGPDGWTMPVCEVASAPGERYRFEWANDAGESFGFEGELLESDPPRRAVTTESMIGVEGPGTVNDMTLEESDGNTLLTLVITYPSAEVRDMILATGMVDGMETSYQRLEREVLGAAS